MSKEQHDAHTDEHEDDEAPHQAADVTHEEEQYREERAGTPKGGDH